MPRTGIQSTGGLEISISNVKSLRPGDTIQGQVALKAGFKPPNQVQLEFFGRAKTKFSQHHELGDYHSTHRARAPLVRDQRTLVQQRLDAGGEHNGQVSWPFSLPIHPHPLPLPKQSNNTTGPGSLGDGSAPLGQGVSGKDDSFWPQHRSFLSSEDNSERWPLPSVFFVKQNEPSREAYVEYVLSATAVNPEKPGDKWSATAPLMILTPSTEHPIADFQPNVVAYRIPFQSSKLVQHGEAQDGKKSFSKKIAKAFSSSQKYAVRVYLQSPSVIQLDHPEPLAFKVWMMPILHPEFTTVTPAQAPPVTITGASISLRATYLFRAPKTPTSKKFDPNMEICNAVAKFMLMPPLTFPEPIVLSPVWDSPLESLPVKAATTGPHANHPPGFRNAVNLTPPPGPGVADLGTALGITIHANKSVFHGPAGDRVVEARWPRMLSPSFSTYNIAVEYALLVVLETSCAGKSFKVEHESPVRVLAPSEAQLEALEATLGPEGMQTFFGSSQGVLRSGVEMGLDAVDVITSALMA